MNALIEEEEVRTMEGTELESVRGNKLCRNTAPIATTNNGDLIHDVILQDLN